MPFSWGLCCWPIRLEVTAYGLLSLHLCPSWASRSVRRTAPMWPGEWFSPSWWCSACHFQSLALNECLHDCLSMTVIIGMEHFFSKNWCLGEQACAQCKWRFMERRKNRFYWCWNAIDPEAHFSWALHTGYSQWEGKLRRITPIYPWNNHLLCTWKGLCELSSRGQSSEYDCIHVLGSLCPRSPFNALISGWDYSSII